ncbi:hypothetical protein EDB19DRAFT_1795310 [Suillus lakei]|nr:hypothetical protein EDB19DRAFT_1795310 [Suillus lakei]
MVFGNHWSISRDPDAFPSVPRSSLSIGLTIKVALGTISNSVFWFGWRVCPCQTRSLFSWLSIRLWILCSRWMTCRS